jgi:hypothetical protein
MDNRKLILTTDWNAEGQPCTSIRLSSEAEAAQSTGLEIAEALDGDAAAELVRRHNAFPALVEALEGLLDAGTVDLDQACKDARALLATLKQ